MFSESGSTPLISVESVSKGFPLLRTPRDRLRFAFSQGSKANRNVPRHWALRDVSFQVERGESVGIVGRNGAGKSTLLQIIAGTVTPNGGTVHVGGQVAALLQLGAGFHPEYTGRENVFLNGAILGLDRRQIAARMEEIEAFADIGEHLDRPVKTYSTGMNSRLAFAVAICSEPEILIVDEVLAVGDLLFQQKCITRIRQMQEAGLTLLFVSHSTARVNGLCQRALLLKGGRAVFFGDAEDCTNRYLADLRTEANQEHEEGAVASVVAAGAIATAESATVRRQTRGVLRYGTQHVKVTEVKVLTADGVAGRDFHFGDKIVIEVHYHSEVHSERLNVSFLVRDDAGVDLTGTMTHDEGVTLPDLAPGQGGVVRFAFANRLRPGHFGVSVAVTRINLEDERRPLLYDQIDGVAGFAVVADPKRPVHYKFDSRVEVEIP
jgi:lipopolysaccharide transport system ATP-binding protein